jgi:YndJ-like protein
VIAFHGLYRLVSPIGRFIPLNPRDGAEVAFPSFEQFCFSVGQGYLAVAGAWLVASRAGLHPAGFEEPIVLLTAMHFHFAGFASAIIAGLTVRRFRGQPGANLVRAAALAVVVGPGLLGLAFLAGPKVKLIGALLVAVGQIGLAAAMARISLQARRGWGRWLLLVAAGSVATGMIFAAVWAIGEYPLQPFVDIRKMAQIHGVLNALGFAGCALLAWTELTRRDVWGEVDLVVVRP